MAPNYSMLVIEFRTQLFKSCELFPKNIVYDYIYLLAEFRNKII